MWLLLAMIRLLSSFILIYFYFPFQSYLHLRIRYQMYYTYPSFSSIQAPATVNSLQLSSELFLHIRCIFNTLDRWKGENPHGRDIGVISLL